MRPGMLPSCGPFVVQPDGQREPLARAGGRHAARHRGGVDQVDGAALVVVAPTSPVGDLGGERLELRRQGHGPVVYSSGYCDAASR